MTKKPARPGLSLFACFMAVEFGAWVAISTLSVREMGWVGLSEATALWAIGQVAILPLAIVIVPIGLLLREWLGHRFEQPRPIALLTGLAVGVVIATMLMFATGNSENTWLWTEMVIAGAWAGFCAGWVWWQIERPYLQ